MKICFTLSSLAAGGAERVAVSLANSFSRNGHDVTLLLVSIDHNNSFYDINEDVKVIPLLKSKSDKNPFRRIRLLKRELLSLKPDIVISFLPHICIYTYFALRKTSIPFICSERNDPNKYNFLYKFLLKKSFHKANGAVFQTEDAKKFYLNSLSGKNCIIPNPVFLTLSSPIVSKKEKDKLFISVGRLTDQKNFPLLIESFTEFHKNHKDFNLFIYGEGPKRPELEKLISELNLNDCVSLPGTCKTWHDVALNATAFISSSNYEGMPNCLEEALCLGCKCIATDCPVGGSKLLINDLGNGILIPTNNKTSLVDAMNSIIRKNETALPSYTKYKVETVANLWIDFINEVLKK